MDVAIKNVMEEIVIRETEKIMEGTDCCRCDNCKSDVAAYVLNRLEPKYVRTEKGELFSRAILSDPNFKGQLTVLIAQAISHVAENPNHVAATSA